MVEESSVFLPIIAAHQITATNIALGVIAFIAFSMTASAIYIINDVADLEDDRAHPRKRRRPFAAGDLAPATGLVVAGGLLLCGMILGLALSWAMLGVLVFYILVTTAYTFLLKRWPIFDVVTLAGLYTLRVFAGAIATGIALSSWLLLFSICIFLSLGIVKRISEVRLVEMRDDGKTAVRGYTIADANLLLSMSMASGYGATLVFALYAASPDVQVLYQSPVILFAVCPLLFLWISRAVLIANRGEMDDDPLVFAVTDKFSMATGAAIAGLLALGAQF